MPAKVARRGRQAVPRGIRPAVHYFKRSRITSVHLNDATTWPSNWGVVSITEPQVAGTMVYKLDDLPGHTDFTSLFTMYKINAVSSKWYISATNSSATSSGNRQVQMFHQPNPTGEQPSLGEDFWMQSQIAKVKNLINADGKPARFYSRVKQHRLTYSSITNSDYAVVSPRYISTTEDQCAHYGDSFMIQPLYTANDIPDVYLKIVETYYIQCKMVK